MSQIKNRFTGLDFKEVIPASRIKMKDTFDMKNLYEIMHDWLVEEGYAPSNDFDFKEIFYLHRWLQGGMEEVRFWWRHGKTPDDSSFIKYELDVNAIVIGRTKVEVVYDGNKYKADKGEMEVSVRARLIFDSDRKWRNHLLLKHFYPLFRKRIYKANYEKHKKQLTNDVHRFLEFLKTHLGLNKYKPEPEGEQFIPDYKYK